jgi:Uma2 family endonuclease
MATVTIRIGPADQGRAMSLEEFRAAEEEEGYRYELAEGFLEVTDVPGPVHRRVVSNLYRLIARYDQERPGTIECFGGASEFRLGIPLGGKGSGRNPDLGVVLEGTLPDEDGRTQPALVAEVVSKNSRVRDYQEKPIEYLASGIQEYWIVDPWLRQVTVLVRAQGVWTEQVLRDEQGFSSGFVKGLNCRVADLWVGVIPDDQDS